MDTCVLHAQSLKRVGVGQHRTPLLDQGGEATGEVVRLSHAERKHLLGFLWGWRTTQGGQAQRDAIGEGVSKVLMCYDRPRDGRKHNTCIMARHNDHPSATLPHTLRPIAARSLHVLLGDSAVIRRASTP